MARSTGLRAISDVRRHAQNNMAAPGWQPDMVADADRREIRKGAVFLSIAFVAVGATLGVLLNATSSENGPMPSAPRVEQEYNQGGFAGRDPDQPLFQQNRQFSDPTGGQFSTGNFHD
jgi:hypothetical protein